jgi:hypothetical protein
MKKPKPNSALTWTPEMKETLRRHALDEVPVVQSAELIGVSVWALVRGYRELVFDYEADEFR